MFQALPDWVKLLGWLQGVAAYWWVLGHVAGWW